MFCSYVLRVYVKLHDNYINEKSKNYLSTIDHYDDEYVFLVYSLIIADNYRAFVVVVC